MELHSPQSYIKLSQQLQEQGDFEAAFRHAQKALELQPNFGEALLEMGKILDHNGQIDDALTCYEEAFRLSPNLWEAQWRVGQIFDRKGLNQLALDTFQAVMEAVPQQFPQTEHLHLARAFLHQQNYKAAIKSTLNSPSLAEAWRIRALCTIGLEDIEGTIENLATAQNLEDGINLAPEYTHLAKLALKRNQFAQVEECLQTALMLSPDFVEAHFYLSLNFVHQGKLREAFLGFQELLDIDRGYAPAYYELGIIANKLQKWEEAKAFFDAARTLNPNIYPETQTLIDQLKFK